MNASLKGASNGEGASVADTRHVATEVRYRCDDIAGRSKRLVAV
jgi:hypothetical protein